MPKFVPLSRTLHGNKTWKRAPDYRFAAKVPVVPIVAQEVAAASSEMPLGFVGTGQAFELVALVSRRADENLYVAPDGAWLVKYVPALLRAHPFRLLRPKGSEKMVLCIDEDSDRVKDGAGEEIFFDDGDKPAKAVREVLRLLEAVERNRHATSLAVQALAQAGVIVSWEIKIREGDKDVPVKGFHRIDEGALAGLDDAAFLKLRAAAALPLAYGQLISMHQLATLARLVEFRKRLEKARSKSKLDKLTREQVNEMFQLDDDTIRFK
jgi:hypothetical protein